MFELKPLSVAVHRALSTAAIAATVVGPTVAYAQEDEKGVVEGVAEGVGKVVKGVLSVPGAVVKGILGTGDETVEEVVVTGSRIATDANLVSSSPVSMIKAEELDVRGITRVEDLLNDLPSITPEFTANEANGAVGTATIDLRGLTSDRTLVLTNGHRMGFGDVFQLAPDINQVPGALVERIEVLTGGASSTYGSDAMAGVVNFVMKRDFEGLQVDYQYSGYQHSNGNGPTQVANQNSNFPFADGSSWDGGGHDVNVTMGVNSSDGKGNITAYLGYREINPVIQADRDFSSCSIDDADGPFSCAGSATLPTGLFSDFGGATSRLIGTGGSPYLTVQGDQFVPWDYQFYNYAPLNHFQRPDERFTAGAFGHYEVNEHFEAYAEFQFMDDKTNAQIAPSGAFFVTTSLNCNNPLLSAQQAGAIGCTAAQIAAAPGDVTANVPLYIGRRNVEGGPRNDDIQHTSYRLLFGAKGEINDNWTYDAFVNISRTDLSELYNNDLSTTRITRALNVVAGPGGAPTCQSVIDGSDPACVPWNVFQTGGVTQNQINYLFIDLFAQGSLKQDQYVGFVAGELTNYGIVSPMAEDGMQIVLGGEFRDERMNYQPDAGYQSGDGAGQGGPTAAVSGAQSVTEFFVEAQIPLAQNQDWIESLTLDVGYRYSDYDLGGSTDTYKFQGEYTPVSGFKFRGGYSRASRVANIRELFEPNNLGLWAGVDPCAGPTPAQSAAQCANSGVTAAQYGQIPLSPAGQYNGIFGGNTGLTPETSNSFTVGAVFTPDQIPGFQLSIDYWSIDIKDAIDDVQPEFIVTQCGLTGDPTFCNLVNRSPANGNLWIGSSLTAPSVTSTNVNIGFFETSGIDVASSYAMEIGEYGSLDFSLRGTWTEKWLQQLAPGSAIEDCAGMFGGSCQRPRPEWKHSFSTTWTTPWDITMTAGWRYIQGVDDFQGNMRSAGDESYIDLSMSYTPQWIGYGETVINIGVSNLLDNDPPINGFFNNISTFGNGNTVPGLWDALGRYMFFGVTQKF